MKKKTLESGKDDREKQRNREDILEYSSTNSAAFEDGHSVETPFSEMF